MKDAYEKIGSALDRFQEAHFWIHMMEQYYHDAEPFRWHLNVFLKALKEVPQLVQMELQHETNFAPWFRDHRKRLNADPLIATLAKKRDLVVHKKMLLPESRGSLGITEGRGMKFGITFPIHPLEDSDHGMERFLRQTKTQGDFFGFLAPDEDSLPCIWREWRLPDFDDEIVEVCARAWLRTGELIDEVLRWQGTDPPPLSLDCRHSTQRMQFKMYDRNKLIEQMETIEGVPNDSPAGGT